MDDGTVALILQLYLIDRSINIKIHKIPLAVKGISNLPNLLNH